MKIIGIGGLPRSGKDTLAEWLIEKGYFGVSLGDIVRNVSRQRHADQSDPISVANMTETSNWLRQTKGPDFALNEAITQFNEANEAKKQASYKGVVIYSVRAPVEADFIVENGGQLVWVEASDEVRYVRAMDKLREGETKLTVDEFRSQENLQWQPQPGIPAESQMNVEYVKSKVNITIENNGSLEEFQAAAEKALGL